MTYMYVKWFNLDRFVHLVAMAFTACRLLLLRSTVVRTIAGASEKGDRRQLQELLQGSLDGEHSFKRFSHMISDVTELLLVGVHRIMLPPRTAVYVSNNFLQDSSSGGFENKIEKHQTNLCCSHGEAVFAHEA